MELTKLYVLEINGEKHFYASDIDRNYAFNILPYYEQIHVKETEIDLKNEIIKVEIRIERISA